MIVTVLSICLYAASVLFAIVTGALVQRDEDDAILFGVLLTVGLFSAATALQVSK